MNQYFNKKSIEAAIRVALVNPNTDIYINGKRSKKRYKFVFDELTMQLYYGTKAVCGVCFIFHCDKIDEEFLKNCTNYFSTSIRCGKED